MNSRERRSEMNMPGFTAEVSLGKRKEAYTLARAFSRGGSRVESQYAVRCHPGYGCDMILPNPDGDPIIVHIPEELNY
jgi:hypothetical protein